jgi:hypothetical protein
LIIPEEKQKSRTSKKTRIPTPQETSQRLQSLGWSEPQALLYLNRHISITNALPDEPQANESVPCSLSTRTRKTAFILSESVSFLATKYGVGKIGFLTLTFAEHIICHKVAQKRLNSLLTNIINHHYPDYIGCVERQKSGRIHYHILLVMPEDIREGFNFKAAADKDYSSASPYLRSQWAFWRRTAKSYGFGRTELLPVKTNMDAMAKYVGKYIGKHMDNRHKSDKGARLVRFSRGARSGTTNFMFVSKGSADWRRKVKTFVQIVNDTFEQRPSAARLAHSPLVIDKSMLEQSTVTKRTVTSMQEMTEVLGPKWAYNNREFILSLP